MNLTLTFQISIYLLVTLSSILFMMAEGSVFPQLLTIPLGLLTLFFTDRWEKFSLSPLWANLFGLLAFLVVCAEFFSDIEGRLLSGAHFLVYLTWIILVQKKSDTQYWWLCTLGFLQIAVGSVLTESGYYGILLVVYLFLAIWTLSVFSLYRTRNTFLLQKSQPETSGLTIEKKEVVSPFQAQSHVHGGIQSEQNRQWLTRGIICASISYSVSALFISMCFFLLIPRIWINRSAFSNDALAATSQPLVGFSEKVQLGEMGEILESSERVLELAMYDNETNEPVPVTEFVRKFGLDEPLFRGAVLSKYKNGSWSREKTNSRWRFYTENELENKALYRQEIALESIGTNILFMMPPFVGMDMMSDTENRLNTETLEVYQTAESNPNGITKYNTYTAKDASKNIEFDQPVNSKKYLKLPRRDLKRLIKYTKELIASHPELQSKREKAKFLEAHLRDSGEFSYTLNMSIQDPTIDPVEDFLFNRKSGHCEYYASALALMLRAIDIPARVLSGFKGCEEKMLSNRIEVQQRFAHSWVEAFLDEHWETLDATPALQRAEIVAKNAPSFSSWNGFSKMMSQFWSDYVIGVSIQRQRQAFYNPILNAVKNLHQKLLDLRSLLVGFAESAKRFLLNPRRWFSWEGGAAVFIIAGLILGIKWLILATVKLARLLFRQKSKQRNALNSADVAFYEKFRSLLAQKGLVRHHADTQKEFSDHVEVELNSELTQAQISDYPDLFTKLFYKVRYGNHQLGSQESIEVQHKLRTFESALFKENETHN